MDEKTIITIIATGLGAGGLGASWWFKNWIKRVDKHLENLTKDVQTLLVAHAVSKEQKSNFDGSLSQLQTCINSTTKDVGILSASISKLWTVIEKVPGIGIKSRTSDEYEDS